MPGVEGFVSDQGGHQKIILAHESGLSPRIKTFFLDGSPLDEVYYDSNNNKLFDQGDQKLSSTETGRILYAINTFTAHTTKKEMNDLEAMFGLKNIMHRRVQYLYFVKAKLRGELSVKMEHPYSKKIMRIKIAKGEVRNLSTDFHYPSNKVQNLPPLHLGPGIIEIKKDTAYTRPIYIKGKTTFLISEGVNLIFKNK